ncbi:MAG: hypothetical protein ACI4MZ_07025 [Christensenellales bacterium]
MEWIIPVNLKYYDVFGESSRFGVIEWRQRLKDVSVGDIVYIYLSKPESYIAFKCIVEKVNVRRLSRTIDDSAYFKDDTLQEVHLYMTLRPIKEYTDNVVTGKMILGAGIARIQSQRKVSPSLSAIIKSVE